MLGLNGYESRYFRANMEAKNHINSAFRDLPFFKSLKNRLKLANIKARLYEIELYQCEIFPLN